jgi:hypothetical protein
MTNASQSLSSTETIAQNQSGKMTGKQKRDVLIIYTGTVAKSLVFAGVGVMGLVSSLNEANKTGRPLVPWVTCLRWQR